MIFAIFEEIESRMRVADRSRKIVGARSSAVCDVDAAVQRALLIVAAQKNRTLRTALMCGRGENEGH